MESADAIVGEIKLLVELYPATLAVHGKNHC